MWIRSVSICFDPQATENKLNWRGNAKIERIEEGFLCILRSSLRIIITIIVMRKIIKVCQCIVSLRVIRIVSLLPQVFNSLSFWRDRGEVNS